MFYIHLGPNSRCHGPRQCRLRDRTYLRTPTYRHLLTMVSHQQCRPSSLPRRQQQKHLRQLHKPDPIRPRTAMDRHHLRRRRQHQNRRQPTHRRALEPNVRRHSHQRTRISRNAHERTQSATVRRQHPIHHDAGCRQTSPRWRIIRLIPLSPRPQRVRHLQSRVEPRQDLLREARQGVRTRCEGSMRCECAVGR